MKKLLSLALPLLVFSGIASAVPQCSTGTFGGVAGDWSLAQLAGAGCEIGDKIFSNFTGATGDPTDSFSFFTSGANNYNILLTTGNELVFVGTFNFGYRVTIDQTQVVAGKTATLATLTGNIGDSTVGSASTLVKTNSVNGCTLTVTDSGAGNVSSSAPCGFVNPTTTVTMSETYTYTGNAGGSGVTSLQNTFTQVLTATQSSPEPVSMLLFGSGMLALGFIGRKRIARK